MTDDEWNKQIRDKQYPWMTDDQFECLMMLADLFHGLHHVFGNIQPSGNVIVINTRHVSSFATFDFDALTRAVVMAHDRMIRFEIAPSGPGMLKLFFHKRNKREGKIQERHPTIEGHIATIRGVSPNEPEETHL